MKKSTTLAAILLAATSLAAQAEFDRYRQDSRVASPNSRIAGAVCLTGLTECFVLNPTDQMTVPGGDLRFTSIAPGLAITTGDIQINLANMAVNECYATTESITEMSFCLAGKGYQVQSYIF